jgi:hypothetical protein
MEADWEFDIAADAALIDAHWAGHVDLQQDLPSVHGLSETAQLPALASVLVQLNGSRSALWTSKCDVWVEEEFDPDELDAAPGSAAFSLACYIDLLSRDSTHWTTPDAVADWCRRVRSDLEAQPLRQCRADFVIRTAAFQNGNYGFGITAYVIGCGVSPDEARESLSTALRAFAQTTVALSNSSKYNEDIVGE